MESTDRIIHIGNPFGMEHTEANHTSVRLWSSGNSYGGDQVSQAFNLGLEVHHLKAEVWCNREGIEKLRDMCNAVLMATDKTP